ncbi:hypothetical protein IWX48DRAFT_612109, partial [Phyllosticta citricarpa]
MRFNLPEGPFPFHPAPVSIPPTPANSMIGSSSPLSGRASAAAARSDISLSDTARSRRPVTPRRTHARTHSRPTDRRFGSRVASAGSKTTATGGEGRIRVEAEGREAAAAAALASSEAPPRRGRWAVVGSACRYAEGTVGGRWSAVGVGVEGRTGAARCREEGERLSEGGWTGRQAGRQMTDGSVDGHDVFRVGGSVAACSI